MIQQGFQVHKACHTVTERENTIYCTLSTIIAIQDNLKGLKTVHMTTELSLLDRISKQMHSMP